MVFDYEKSEIVATDTERNARLRRMAIRIAARNNVSYDEGVVIRDEFLHSAMTETFGDKTEEVVWQNLFPGSRGSFNDRT